MPAAVKTYHRFFSVLLRRSPPPWGCRRHPPTLQKGNAGTGYKLLFGRRCDIYRDLQSNDGKVSPQVLCEALGNPVKAQILSLLNKNEFTVTQLSDQLFLARQTVNRHVLWLLDFMFIKVSKMTGTEIYYQINRHFFKSADIC
ncbi:MAG: winged helix-turn-helix transcriptional regulator [Clostridiales bacterium]|nr:winged helix-turn-helix transcriptional regulator [Clostridiales bacterium]